MTFKARPGQDKVIAYRKGYLAVPAVPGAGKTTVLAYLTADLIASGLVGKGKVLIVTYMNSAVANFRARISEFLKQRGFSPNRGFEVRTLHSLALRIIKEKPAGVMTNESFTVLDDYSRKRILAEVIDKWLGKNEKRIYKFFEEKLNYQRVRDRWREQDFPEYISRLLDELKLLAGEGKEIRDLRRKIKRDSYLAWGLEIYLEYSKVLAQNAWLDFTDLIVKARQLLQTDPDLCRRLRRKYTYIFEDEAQDSNRIQEQLLFLLAGREGNLIRVGDSNQAILSSFTASDADIFRQFSARKDVETSSILYSSRSSQDIIDLANYLVYWTRNKHPLQECRQALENQPIKAVPPGDPFPNPVVEGYKIAYQTYPDSKVEIKKIARQVVAVAEKYPEETIAILVPTNYQLKLFAEELQSLQADFTSLGHAHLQGDKTAEELKDILSYLAKPYDQTLFKNLIRIILPGIDDAWLRQILENIYLEDLIYPPGGWDNLKLNTELSRNCDLAAFFQVLERVERWVAASIKLPPDELILFLAEELELREEELAIAQNMALHIRREMSYHSYWKLADIVAELPELLQSIKGFARKIKDFKGFEPEAGKISLATLHKAKGLEWDTVFISHLTNNYFPSYLEDDFQGEFYYLQATYSNPLAVAKAELAYYLKAEPIQNPIKEAKLEVIQEKLRLLYVGISRARKRLFLSSNLKINYENAYEKKVQEAEAYRALVSYIKERNKENVS